MKRLCIAFLVLASSQLNAQPGYPPSSAPIVNIYSNPVITDMAADPCIVEYLGEYFLYSTQSTLGYNVYRSHDLISWSGPHQVYSAPSPVGNPWNKHNYWAPDVKLIDGKFYLYYTAGNGTISEGTDLLNQRIGVAVAESPMGPFTDLTPQSPLIPDRSCIDAFVFEDRNGDLFILYAGFDTNPDQIRVYGRRLASPFQLDIGAEQLLLGHVVPPDFEFPISEAPEMFEHAGRYLLLDSNNPAYTARYRVDASSSSTPLGPFSRQQGPIFSSNSVIELFGPGHGHSMLAPDLRSRWYAYHAKTFQSDGWERTISMDPLLISGPFSDGKVTVLSNGGTKLGRKELLPRPSFISAMISTPHLPSGWAPVGGDWCSTTSSCGTWDWGTLSPLANFVLRSPETGRLAAPLNIGNIPLPYPASIPLPMEMEDMVYSCWWKPTPPELGYESDAYIQFSFIVIAPSLCRLELVREGDGLPFQRPPISGEIGFPLREMSQLEVCFRFFPDSSTFIVRVEDLLCPSEAIESDPIEIALYEDTFNHFLLRRHGEKYVVEFNADQVFETPYYGSTSVPMSFIETSGVIADLDGFRISYGVSELFDDEWRLEKLFSKERGNSNLGTTSSGDGFVSLTPTVGDLTATSILLTRASYRSLDFSADLELPLTSSGDSGGLIFNWRSDTHYSSASISLTNTSEVNLVITHHRRLQIPLASSTEVVDVSNYLDIAGVPSTFPLRCNLSIRRRHSYDELEVANHEWIQFFVNGKFVHESYLGLGVSASGSVGLTSQGSGMKAFSLNGSGW